VSGRVVNREFVLEHCYSAVVGSNRPVQHGLSFSSRDSNAATAVAREQRRA
jgi:hypothetical protein